MSPHATSLAMLCYCASALVVLIGLCRYHYNRDLTWLEAFQANHGDQAWVVVSLFALMPVTNTVIALEFLLFPSVFDRINDD